MNGAVHMDTQTRTGYFCTLNKRPRYTTMLGQHMWEMHLQLDGSLCFIEEDIMGFIMGCMQVAQKI